jgi:hypothetical protein
MKPSLHKNPESRAMGQNNEIARKIHEEFVGFRKTMEELRMLKQVAADLRNYRKMIELKRYD